MPPIVSLRSLVGALVVATVAFSLLPPLRSPRRRTHPVQPTENTPMDHTVWVNNWPHDAPDSVFAVDDAHREMRKHRACHLADCPRKAAAWQVLVTAGHVVPRSKELP
jgi:hypothetical protein